MHRQMYTKSSCVIFLHKIRKVKLRCYAPPHQTIKVSREDPVQRRLFSMYMSFIIILGMPERSTSSDQHYLSVLSERTFAPDPQPLNSCDDWKQSWGSPLQGRGTVPEVSDGNTKRGNMVAEIYMYLTDCVPWS